MEVYILGGILLLIIILYIPLYINIVFKRKDKKNFLEINLKLMKGIIKVGIDIPLLKIIKKRGNIILKIKNKLEAGKKGKDVKEIENEIPLQKIIKKIDKLIEINYILKPMKDYLTSKIRIQKLVWSTKVGLDDAALTGLSTGILMSVKSFIISLIVKDKSFKKINLVVVPKFTQNIFETYFHCIIRFKLVYIIIAGFYGIKAKFKGGEASARSSD